MIIPATIAIGIKPMIYPPVGPASLEIPPGIYHRKEAKAAEVFGFTRFVQAEQDESEENEMFGYWCRKVRHMRSK